MKAVCARLTSYGLLALMSEHLNTQIHCTCVPLQCAICIKHISCSKWQIMFVSFKLNVLDSIYTVSFTPIGNYLLWFVQGRIEGGGATNQVSLIFSLCDGYLYKVILYWRIWEDLLCSLFMLDASSSSFSLSSWENILSFFLSFHDSLLLFLTTFVHLSFKWLCFSYMFHIPSYSEISCVWDCLYLMPSQSLPLNLCMIYFSPSHSPLMIHITQLFSFLLFWLVSCSFPLPWSVYHNCLF